MTFERVASLIRHIATFGGGFLVTKGVTDHGTVEVIVGGVIAGLGLLWGVFSKKAE